MIDVSDRLSALAPSEQTLVGYLFWLSRPRFWFYLAGPVVVGVAYGASSTAEYFTPLTVALFAYFLVPANVFLYGINDLFDADIDEVNPKKSDEGREVQYRGSRSVTVIVVCSALAAVVFVPALPTVGVAALAGFLLLGTTYSAPPVRFKTTPLLDSISNGLYIMPGLVAYAALAGELPPTLVIVGGWLWTMGMHTFSAIPDIEPDRAAGIQTTATVLGRDRTLAYCAGCWLAAAGAMGVVHPFFAAVLAIYPLFVVGIVLASVDIDRAYWWFPVLNTVAGALLTMAAVWRLTYA
ncbi:prenyltransferase [Halovenus sp. WSH3]|uniref:Prenyltransferase n=1 Tax=Halovenus carboxidivorans TaxID=2692199 RepID=A0A6B0T2A2_9EURY|nr:prenyltransferase [Halovenus carboxidivorans]